MSRSHSDSFLFVVCQKNVDDEHPTPENIHKYGTLCRIISYTLPEPGKQ